jgi:hypothetical protein
VLVPVLVPEQGWEPAQEPALVWAEVQAEELVPVRVSVSVQSRAPVLAEAPAVSLAVQGAPPRAPTFQRQTAQSAPRPGLGCRAKPAQSCPRRKRLAD